MIHFQVADLGFDGAGVTRGPEGTHIVVDINVDPDDWTRHVLGLLSITEAIELLELIGVPA